MRLDFLKFLVHLTALRRQCLEIGPQKHSAAALDDLHDEVDRNSRSDFLLAIGQLLAPGLEGSPRDLIPRTQDDWQVVRAVKAQVAKAVGQSERLANESQEVASVSPKASECVLACSSQSLSRGSLNVGALEQ